MKDWLIGLTGAAALVGTAIWCAAIIAEMVYG